MCFYFHFIEANLNFGTAFFHLIYLFQKQENSVNTALFKAKKLWSEKLFNIKSCYPFHS